MRITPAEYTSTILRASAADITGVNQNELPTIDLDDRFGEISDGKESDAATRPDATDASRARASDLRVNETQRTMRDAKRTTANIADDVNQTSKRKRRATTEIGAEVQAETQTQHAQIPASDDATTAAPELSRAPKDPWGTAKMSTLSPTSLTDTTLDDKSTSPNTIAATLMYDTNGCAQWYKCTITKINKTWPHIRLQNGRQAVVAWEKLRLIK